ncbi:MAG: ABC transporter ATP-binding protein, partial [Chloroflexota bacterium]
EATANLDPITEAMLQEGLSELITNRTTFIIAHKLSSIKKADRILVFESGEIIADGSHEHLMETSHKYMQIYDNYFSYQIV